MSVQVHHAAKNSGGILLNIILVLATPPLSSCSFRSLPSIAQKGAHMLLLGCDRAELSAVRECVQGLGLVSVLVDVNIDTL